MTRILLAGLGNRGRMWGRIIAERAGTELAGIMDVDPARIAAFQADRGPVPSYTDLATALTESQPDLVVLATPPGGHLDQARQIFAAGIPLLCEKPLALDLQEAAEIVRLSEQHGVLLSVGLNFRYLPVTRAIRTFVAEAPFGAPGFGSFAYHRNRDWWRPGMNSYPQTMQHPMMLEQSIHHLDLIRFCYGREVEQVQCRSWNPTWSVYAHDANVSCLLSMQGGLEVDYVGTWTGGWNALKFQWRTDCPDGVIIQNELFSDLSTARTEDVALTPAPLAPCIPFLDDTRALLDAVIAAMPLGGDMPCSGRDHLRSLALCFAAIEADETGRRVDVAEFQRRHGLPG